MAVSSSTRQTAAWPAGERADSGSGDSGQADSAGSCAAAGRGASENPARRPRRHRAISPTALGRSPCSRRGARGLSTAQSTLVKSGTETADIRSIPRASQHGVRLLPDPVFLRKPTGPTAGSGTLVPGRSRRARQGRRSVPSLDASRSRAQPMTPPSSRVMAMTDQRGAVSPPSTGNGRRVRLHSDDRNVSTV